MVEQQKTSYRQDVAALIKANKEAWLLLVPTSRRKDLVHERVERCVQPTITLLERGKAELMQVFKQSEIQRRVVDYNTSGTQKRKRFIVDPDEHRSRRAQAHLDEYRSHLQQMGRGRHEMQQVASAAEVATMSTLEIIESIRHMADQRRAIDEDRLAAEAKERKNGTCQYRRGKNCKRRSIKPSKRRS